MNRKRLIVLFLLLVFAWGLSCQKKSTLSTASPETAMYVASYKRDPFHSRDCRWAQKISPANAVYYDTREEAIADGHRPCKVCNP